MRAVHAGTSIPTADHKSLPWSEFDREGFGVAIKIFSKFIVACDRKYIESRVSKPVLTVI